MQRTPAILIGAVALILAAVAAFLVLSSLGEGVGPAPTAEPSRTVGPSASPGESLAAELLDRRWNVLFVGTDATTSRAERGEGANADSLMLVSLSEDQSELTLVSVPRDTVDLPLGNGERYPRKINALYEEQGAGAVVDSMEALFDVSIDGYVVLDMEDFIELVAAVDGVDVSPEEPLADPIVDLDLQPGPQHLDARAAQGYVRTRVDQDYGRMARQQEVLLALVERLVDEDRDVELRSLLDGLDSLETDLPLDKIPTLLELAGRATDARVHNLIIEPPLITFEGDRGDGRGYVLEPDVEAIRDEVQSLIGD